MLKVMRYGINCNENCVYPIEQLFKSIYYLQSFPECKRLVEDMSRKLRKYFLRIEEHEGKRVYAKEIIFYPNGVCEWDGLTIILNGWESKYQPVEPPTLEERVKEESKQALTAKKNKSVKRNINTSTALKRDYLLWYMQLQNHNKKKYRITEENNYGLPNICDKYKAYCELEELDKKMLEDSHNFSRDFERYGRKIYDHFIRYHKDNGKPNGKGDRFFKIFLLDNDELDTLQLLCNQVYFDYQKQKKRFYSRKLGTMMNDAMTKFVKELDYERDDRVCLNLSGSVGNKEVLSFNGFDNGKPSYSYGEELSFQEIIPKLHVEANEVENENAQKLFKDLGLI